MAKLRITLVPVFVTAFAVFALAAQFSKGINMNLSPAQMAALQPYALWQALLGSVTGSILGFRGGQAIARARHGSPRGSQMPAAVWVHALSQLMPWVVASFLSREGYESLMITSPWVITWVTRLLPLTRAFDLSFLFGFAIGYFWAENPDLARRASVRPP